MSFQAYLENIQAKTGKSPADFRRLATEKGFSQGGKLKEGVNAGAVLAWLKADFALGHGHAMAIVALLKGKKDGRGFGSSYLMEFPVPVPACCRASGNGNGVEREITV